LDSGNNKKALQEADRLLKKQKDFPCAKACNKTNNNNNNQFNSDLLRDGFVLDDCPEQ